MINIKPADLSFPVYKNKTLRYTNAMKSEMADSPVSLSFLPLEELLK